MRLMRTGRMRAGGVLAALAALGATTEGAEADFPPVRPITSADSVLVVAPHPDDESLCCGGLIDSARRAGAAVAVVWITSGDGFRWDAMVVERKLRPRGTAYEALGQRRTGEARKAAAFLDVSPKSQFFLGYPDRGILSLVLDHYYFDTAWRSKYTRDSTVTLHDAVAPGSAYDGADLERDFISVVERVKPTLVLAPSPQDTHPDHRGTGILTYRVMQARGQAHQVRFWVVHGGRGWPAPRGYRPQLPQTVAPRGRGLEWELFPLDEQAIEAKRQAVEAHKTQTEVMNHVMLSHIRSTELYSLTPVPAQDMRCLSSEPCELEDAPMSEKASL